MDTTDRDLRQLELERQADQEDLTINKLNFIDTIKENGAVLKDPEYFIKRPSKFRIILSRIKSFFIKVFISL